MMIVNPNEIFPTNAQYIFLVGAGISTNAPSNLPTAREIMTQLLRFCVPPDYVDILINDEKMRYEYAIEMIEDQLDEQLRFLEYFDLSCDPNIIHYFLAHKMANNDVVITTNHDNLIEIAAEKIFREKWSSLSEKALKKKMIDTVVPIIQLEDFSKYAKKNQFNTSKKQFILKIHGAYRNYITGKFTVMSLKTTTRDMARNRDPLQTFEMDPIKKQLISMAVKNRILIIIGYAGNDDFDISPFLKGLTDIEMIIWINHKPLTSLEITELNPDTPLAILSEQSKVMNLLSQIGKSKAFKIYFIQTNTIDFIENVLWPRFLLNIRKNIILNSSNTIISFKEWIARIYNNTITIMKKYKNACSLLAKIQRIDDLLKCALEGREKAIQDEKTYSLIEFDIYIGISYNFKQEYNEALKYFEESYNLQKNLDFNLNTIKSLIGLTKFNAGQTNNALKDLKIRTNMLSSDRDITNTLRINALLEQTKGNLKKAIEKLLEALKTNMLYGDIHEKLQLLNELGIVYYKNKDFAKAILYLEEALKLSIAIGNDQLRIQISKLLQSLYGGNLLSNLGT